jgi:hypothetical protein
LNILFLSEFSGGDLLVPITGLSQGGPAWKNLLVVGFRKVTDVKDSVFAEQKVLDSPIWAAKINAVEGLKKKKKPMRRRLKSKSKFLIDQE